MNHPIEDILLFTKIAETKTFSQIAIKLDLAVSTITRKISSLEEKLGVKLVIVNHDGFQLTEAGKKLYTKFAHYNFTLEKELDEILSNRSNYQITLNLLLPTLLFSIIPAESFRKILVATPELKLKINIFNGFELPATYNDYDLIIVGTLPESKQFFPRKIFTAKSRLYCSSNYASYYGLPKTIEELAEHKSRILSFTNEVNITSELDRRTTQISSTSSIFGLSINNIDFMNSDHFIIESIQGNRILADGGINVLPGFYCKEYPSYCLKNYYRTSKILDKVESALLNLIETNKQLLDL